MGGSCIQRVDQVDVQHRPIFRALWKWSDRTTFEGEIYSPRREPDASQKDGRGMEVEVG